MIHERAWSVARTTGAEYDELVSVGRTAFMRAVAAFTEAHGARFGTFLHRVLTNALLNAVKSAWYSTRLDGQLDKVKVDAHVDWRMRYQEWLGERSAAAVVMVNLLMNLPEKALKMDDGKLRPKLVRGELVRQAMRVGLTPAECREAIRELKREVYAI